MKRALLLALAACDSEVSTISVELTTAPGSTILDGVQTLRMEVTDPKKVVMAERRGDGFELALDLPAEGTAAAIFVDGFDADGNLVANGATPRFALGGVDGRVVVYMAAPDSIDVAPVPLTVARSGLAAGVLSYGALFAGGIAADGTASVALDIYNAYDHTLVAGKDLPAGRTGLAIGVGSSSAYLFGGFDAMGAAQSQLWSYNPGTAPSGSYVEYGTKEGFAAGGAPLVPIGSDRFLVSGASPAELHGLDGSIVAREDAPELGVGVTVTANDGRLTSIFAGAAGVVRFRDNAFDMLSAPGRDAVSIVAVPGGKVLVVCGASTDALRIDAASGAADTLPGIPSTPKIGCAAAATARHLLIAADDTVEVYDATTFELVTTATLSAPRTGAVAVPLANGQILIAGGADASGAPVGTLELFTPTTR